MHMGDITNSCTHLVALGTFWSNARYVFRCFLQSHHLCTCSIGVWKIARFHNGSIVHKSSCTFEHLHPAFSCFLTSLCLSCSTFWAQLTLKFNFQNWMTERCFFSSFPSHFFTPVRKTKNWFLYVPIGTGPLHKWSLNERSRVVTLCPSTRYDKSSKLYTVGECSRFPCGRPAGRILLSFVQLCFMMSKRAERNHRSEKRCVWVVFPVVCSAYCTRCSLLFMLHQSKIALRDTQGHNWHIGCRRWRFEAH